MRSLLSCVVFGATFAAQAAEISHVLTAEQWAVPRSADTVLGMAPIAKAVRGLSQSGDRLLIRYPGGEEGTLWVTELRAWLVALGVSSTRIDLLPASGRGDVLELQVLRARAAEPTARRP